MENKIKIKVINKSNNELPKIETIGSAGLDIRAFIEKDIILEPSKHILVNTGLYFSIPIGYECQIRSRSGMAFNNGVFVLNSPGTIDSDYRGEIKVLLMNLSDKNFIIHNGDRIAQIVFSKYYIPEYQEVDILPNSDRDNKGFGSTGQN